MAFPVVEASATTEYDDSGPKVLNLPTGISSGDLILVFFRCRASLGNAPPSGFTVLDTISPGLDSLGTVWYKVADGTESGTIAYTDTGSPHRAAIIAHRISGVESSNPVESANGFAASLDPPSETPSWGSADTLWFTSMSKLATTGPITQPTGFGNFLASRVGGGTTNNNFPATWTADLQSAVSSVNPDAWVDGGSGTLRVSITVAVQPTAPSPPAGGGNRMGGTGAIRRPRSRRPAINLPPPAHKGPPPDRGRPADKGPPPGQDSPTTEPPSGPGPEVDPPVDDNWLPPRGGEDE